MRAETLTKLRCVGGGPEYMKFGRKVRYRPSRGRAWAAQRTVKLRNTSEAPPTQGPTAVTKTSASPTTADARQLPHQENAK